MELYLSINNRETVIQLPRLPSELTISCPQKSETYETVRGELNLIGFLGLKTITFNSFLEDGWPIIETLERMRARKLPLRLILTETPINLPVTIESFDITMKRGKKVWYNISLKEFKFMGGVT